MVTASDCVRDRTRWQFGALVPESYAATGNGERAASRIECLAVVAPAARLSLRLSFLQAQHRTVHAAALDGYRLVNALPVDGIDLVPWDETVEQERVLTLSLAELLAGERVEAIDVSGGQDVERVACGRLVRTRHPLTARLRVRARAERSPERFDTSYERAGARGVRISVALTNTCPIDCENLDRAQVMRYSLMDAQAVLTLIGGEFVSVADQCSKTMAENAAPRPAPAAAIT